MIGGTITYKGGSMGKRVNGLRPATKQALMDAIALWHKDFLKFHFGTFGEVNARYPGVYTPRTVSYQIQKGKKYGHQDLLVYSGETRDATLRTISISGTSKKATGRLPGARAFNFNNGETRRDGGTRPNTANELLALNEEEKIALQQFLKDRIAKFLQAQDGGDEVVKFG